MTEKPGLSVSAVAPLLAHQGGWDEIIMFAAPIAVAVGAVWYFERRLRREAQDENKAEPGE